MGRRIPLRERLAQIRAKRQGAPFKPTSKLQQPGPPKVQQYTHGVGEHPTIYGLFWLRLFGESMVKTGFAWDARVSSERWEIDGCVSLHLQRPIIREDVTQLVGLKPVVKRWAVGGDVWDHWRVPIGAVNNHDVGYLAKLVMSPKDAEIVLASPQIRAIHGR